MSERRHRTHKYVMLAALLVSVAALPFSVKVCHGAIIVLILAWMLEGNWQAKYCVLRQSLLIHLIIALFIMQAVGLAFTDNLIDGWFSLEKKIFFLLIPLALASSTVRLRAKEVKWVMTSFVVACFVGTIICIAHASQETNLFLDGTSSVNPYLATSPDFELHAGESEKWLLFSYVSLSEGIGLHPTYFSMFLAFSIIFLLSQFAVILRPIDRIALLLLIVYFTLFIVFLSSRIVIVALSIVYVVVLIRCIMTKSKSMAVLAAGMAVFFVSVLFINPVARYRNLEAIKVSALNVEPGGHYTTAAEIRASLWWLSLASIKQLNPLFGAGTGDVHKVIADASERHQISNVIQSNDPHNQYLYTLIANGIPALAVLLFCLFIPAYWAWIERDFQLLGFLFLFSVVCVTESALELQKGIVFFSMMSSLQFFKVHSFQAVTLNLRSLLRA